MATDQSSGNVYPLPAGARVIPGFPDYCISLDCVVYSRKVYGSRFGRIGPWWPIKLKKSEGYLCFDAFRTPGKPERLFIHRLMPLVFRGPCPEGQQVRHFDGNKLNNSLENLLYGTKVDNANDGIRLGEIRVGEKSHSASRLTDAQVREIRERGARGESHRLIGEDYGIGRHYVAKICCREIWKHIA